MSTVKFYFYPSKSGSGNRMCKVSRWGETDDPEGAPAQEKSRNYDTDGGREKILAAVEWATEEHIKRGHEVTWRLSREAPQDLPDEMRFLEYLDQGTVQARHSYGSTEDGSFVAQGDELRLVGYHPEEDLYYVRTEAGRLLKVTNWLIERPKAKAKLHKPRGEEKMPSSFEPADEEDTTEGPPTNSTSQDVDPPAPSEQPTEPVVPSDEAPSDPAPPRPERVVATTLSDFETRYLELHSELVSRGGEVTQANDLLEQLLPAAMDYQLKLQAYAWVIKSFEDRRDAHKATKRDVEKQRKFCDMTADRLREAMLQSCLRTQIHGGEPTLKGHLYDIRLVDTPVRIRVDLVKADEEGVLSQVARPRKMSAEERRKERVRSRWEADDEKAIALATEYYRKTGRPPAWAPNFDPDPDPQLQIHPGTGTKPLPEPK